MPLALLVLQSRSFELQDTIHELIEENIHLHDQLENLTQALRELKRMLWHHSNGIESSLLFIYRVKIHILVKTKNVKALSSCCGY